MYQTTFQASEIIWCQKKQPLPILKYIFKNDNIKAFSKLGQRVLFINKRPCQDETVRYSVNEHEQYGLFVVVKIVVTVIFLDIDF